MVIYTDTEKYFHRIQHLFMIKTLQNLWIEETSLAWLTDTLKMFRAVSLTNTVESLLLLLISQSSQEKKNILSTVFQYRELNTMEKWWHRCWKSWETKEGIVNFTRDEKQLEPIGQEGQKEGAVLPEPRNLGPQIEARTVVTQGPQREGPCMAGTSNNEET